jgi:hypothetical protein
LISALAVSAGAQLPQLAHIGRAPGKAEQASLMIEGPIQIGRAQPLPQLMQQQPRIDRATAAGHHQALHRCEAHGGGHAAACSNGAERAAGAQMGADQPW